jgi:NADPH:quinone reductase-like Zn-dependent oxidoreductase
MKATVFHEHGSSDVLVYEDLPDPDINSHQVLVDIKAVALNHLDLFVREGWPGLNLEFPHILGSDVSGVIKSVGSDVKEGFNEGQHVILNPSVYCGKCEFCIRGEHSLCDHYKILGEHVRGGYAEYISVDPYQVIPVPVDAKLSHSEAASMPLTFMTAWRLLMTKGRLRPGDDLLIIGIGGGVALAALQIAKLVGARVFVTSSSDEKLKKAMDMGAAAGINYTSNPDYHKEIWNLTNRRGVDIVLDSVGQATWERSLRSLRKGGRLVTPGATSGPIIKININLIFWKQLEILGSTMASTSELYDVLKLIWNGSLHPVIDTEFKLSKAKEAHDYLEAGKQFGKVILRP